MEDAALTLILILGPFLTHACELVSVTQKPQFLPSLIGGDVTMTCDVQLRTGDDAKISSFLYRAGNPTVQHNRISRPAENSTLTHILTVTEGSGVYYCRVTCGATFKDGQGTYIHVRGSGFEAPSSASSKLFSVLIALFILLLLLAGSGTYLVLPPFWKRELQEQSPPQTRPKHAVVMESARSGAVVEDAGSSLYTSLEPRSEEVYDILEDQTKEQGTPKKHRAEVHDGAPRSPGKRPKLQAKVSSIKEKPPVKPKPKRNVSENNVYENFKL